jgi:Tfp pilus assembly protein PilF
LREIRFSPTRDKDLIEANAAAERAMRLDPGVALSHLATGEVLYHRKQTKLALAAFEHAAQLDPNEPHAHLMIAMANVALGHPGKALEPLRKAMRLSPRDPDLANYQLWMGVACLHLRRDAEAVDWLTRSVALNGSGSLTRMFLASALALTERETEAKAELCELIRLQPTFTLNEFRSRDVSDEPAFREERERIFGALRQIGAPG